MRQDAAAPPAPLLQFDETPYTLVALENTLDEPGPFAPRYAKGYQLTYGGKKYQIGHERMWDVQLLYKEGNFDHDKLREQPPGWKVTDAPPPPATSR